MGQKTTTNERALARVAQPARRGNTKLPPVFSEASPTGFLDVPASALAMDHERVGAIPDENGDWLVCYFYDGPPTLLVEAPPGGAKVYNHRRAPEVKGIVLWRVRPVAGG